MATTSKKGTPEKKASISYWSKDKVQCPVCKKAFEREIMRSGNGRMIAGGLTEELHRIYEPSAKFGRIYPLIYEIGVLKTYVEPLLYSVDSDSPYYEEAKRLINFLRLFLPIPADAIPADSILREFIGGSYFHE